MKKTKSQAGEGFREVGRLLWRRQNIKELIKREIEDGLDDQKYRNQFRRKTLSLAEDLNNAQNGDDNALFRLLRFKKSLLAEEWVTSIIILACKTKNRTFMKDLGDAIKSTISWGRVSRYDAIKDALKRKVTGYDFNELSSIGV